MPHDSCDMKMIASNHLKYMEYIIIQFTFVKLSYIFQSKMNRISNFESYTSWHWNSFKTPQSIKTHKKEGIRISSERDWPDPEALEWCEWCSRSSSEFYEFIFRSCRICMINDHYTVSPILIDHFASALESRSGLIFRSLALYDPVNRSFKSYINITYLFSIHQNKA